MEKKDKKDVALSEKKSFWKYVFRPVFIRGGYIFVIFMPIFLSFFISIMMVLIANPEKKLFFAKAPIKEVMQKSIRNGGDLRVVKHIYETRNLEGLEFQKIFLPWKLDGYYKEEYPLTNILNDLMIDYLQDSSIKDSIYHQALCDIIEENEKQNPFDNLEENQKYNFENVQTKLDSVYVKIAPDIIKIADELNNKNQLVNMYLSKSEMSFYISIAALIITLFFSIIQIAQNYTRNKEKSNQDKINTREKKNIKNKDEV